MLVGVFCFYKPGYKGLDGFFLSENVNFIDLLYAIPSK